MLTDEDLIAASLSAVERSPGDCVLLRRNGRAFMALPSCRHAAMRTLRMYQPQRGKARVSACIARFAVLSGFHHGLLPRFRHTGGKTMLEPPFDGCLSGTAGVMLGSPEHRVRRAVMSYRTRDGFEVAKLAFGMPGKEVIEGEWIAIRALPEGLPGVPDVLGIHHSADFSLLRIAHVEGRPFRPTMTPRALALLDAWSGAADAVDATSLPEWAAIESSLTAIDGGTDVLETLAAQRLVPAVRHGDFTRWNLILRDDGSAMALDWEWGHPQAMPGLDLVHYFLQDARLVDRMPDADALRHAASCLNLPECRELLMRAGWSGSAWPPLLACIAWKQGAGHQDNLRILQAAVHLWSEHAQRR